MPFVLEETTTRSSLIRAALREMIISGQLKPGQTLVERHLAEMLGVSKTPVREALIALASTGLVRVSYNRGVVVRELTQLDLKDVFELRLLLEPWAIARAAENPHDDFGAAEAALAEAAHHLESGDHVALCLVNRRFHHELYSRTDNGLVTEKLDQVQDLVALAMIEADRRGRYLLERGHVEHRAVLDAILVGQVEIAEKKARDHIRAALALFA
ncbi:MAG TPA: GntR family transcriptional regulator [Pseudonocardia sp.]|nr:GntR family transcriptional regulator [Pseudonocardia sp.]